MSEKGHSTKKRYNEPRLRVYGDIRVMTQAVNQKAGQLDGSFNAMGKALKTA